MKIEEIIKLPLGTKVFLVENAEIQAWQTLGFHPVYKKYFYLCGNGSVEKVKTINLDKKYENSVWETDYDMAKQLMWEQLKKKVSVINDIYMKGEKVISFN